MGKYLNAALLWTAPADLDELFFFYFHHSAKHGRAKLLKISQFCSSSTSTRIWLVLRCFIFVEKAQHKIPSSLKYLKFHLL